MFNKIRKRWAAQKRYWAAHNAASWRLVALTVESDPAARAELLERLSDELCVIGEVVEVAFTRVPEGSSEGATVDGRLMAELAGVERARASSLRRPRSTWARLEEAAGAELDRLAEADMADPRLQARAYRALWSAARPVLPGVHAGETLASIERGTRMRATHGRAAVAFSYQAAVA